MQGMFIFTAMKTIKLSLKISSKSHKICYKGFFYSLNLCTVKYLVTSHIKWSLSTF